MAFDSRLYGNANQLISKEMGTSFSTLSAKGIGIRSSATSGMAFHSNIWLDALILYTSSPKLVVSANKFHSYHWDTGEDMFFSVINGAQLNVYTMAEYT